MATRIESLVSIRPARGADVDDVAAIERAVFNDPWSRRSFAGLVDSPNVIFLVAESDSGAVLGYSIVLIAGVESELANLAVSRLSQKQGVGRKLLNEVVSQAPSRGALEMFLEVRASNEAAIALYRSSGFEPIGRRARYYARPVEDAIVMRAVLPPSPRDDA